LKLQFAHASDAGAPIYIDGALCQDAVAGGVEEGPAPGIYIFTCKARAEEFCWKRGLEFEFVEEDAECAST
jgi:hypothetical protein